MIKYSTFLHCYSAYNTLYIQNSIQRHFQVIEVQWLLQSIVLTSHVVTAMNYLYKKRDV